MQMQGIISHYDPTRKFFFITMKTRQGNGYSLQKFFSHLTRVVALHCDESQIMVGCPVTFEIDPLAVPPGRNQIATNVSIYPYQSVATTAKVLHSVADALSGNQADGGAL